MIADRKSKTFRDELFKNITSLLPKESILVYNNSKVRHSRLYARSETGAQVEFLLLRRIDCCVWEAIVSKAKLQRIGRKYLFPKGVQGEIIGDNEKTKTVRFVKEIDEEYLSVYGNIPLPPYIKRPASEADRVQYQTVYARETGSVAAPTAGLHFSDEILRAVKKRGIHIEYITLHVGIGTFLPVRTDHIEDHFMHEEEYCIEPTVAQRISAAKREGKSVIAVGTTTVRALESAWGKGRLRAGTQTTELYIYPGYTFLCVDGLITNFHTPESSLFVMVSAFAGHAFMQNAYKHAVREKYRFFSYGDSMYIPPMD